MRAEDEQKSARKKNFTITVTVIGVFAIVLAAFFIVSKTTGGANTATAAGETQFVRADSHRLQTAPDGKVTLVEFLDFEYEACKAAIDAALAG